MSKKKSGLGHAYGLSAIAEFEDDETLRWKAFLMVARETHKLGRCTLGKFLKDYHAMIEADAKTLGRK